MNSIIHHKIKEWDGIIMRGFRDEKLVKTLTAAFST